MIQAKEKPQYPILDIKQREKLSGLLRSAYRCAQFDGKEETVKNFESISEAIGDFVYLNSPERRYSGELEIEFSRQAGFKPILIDQAFEKATSSYYDLLAQADHKKLIDELKESGSLIVQYDEYSFVRKDPKQKTSTFKNQREPRMSQLLESLHAKGLYHNDLIIRVGELHGDKARPNPYFVIDIPRIGKQIAVSEQAGADIFLSDQILDAKVYMNMTAQELASLPGVEAVLTNDPAAWQDKVQAYVYDYRLSSRKKFDLEAYEEEEKEKPYPFTEAMIADAMKKRHERTGQWADRDSGIVEEECAVQGFRWLYLDTAALNGWFGLEKDSNLGLIAQKYGLVVPDLTQEDLEKIKDKITEDMIVDAMLDHHLATGENISRDSSRIQSNNELNGFEWRWIEYLLKERGQTISDCTSLPALREKYGYGIYHKGVIVNAMIGHYKKTGQWPTRESLEPIEATSLHGRTWAEIEDYLLKPYNGGCGLEEFKEHNCIDEEICTDDDKEEIESKNELKRQEKEKEKHRKKKYKAIAKAMIHHYLSERMLPGYTTKKRITGSKHNEVNGKTWRSVDIDLLKESDGEVDLYRFQELYKDLLAGCVERIIARAIKEHHKLWEEWPSVLHPSRLDNPEKGIVKTGIMKGKKWSVVCNILREFSSLTFVQLRDKYGLFDEETIWTDAMIIDAIKEHHKKYGEWPSERTSPKEKDGSGIVQAEGELKGVSWRKVHEALVNGHYGLKGGRTLTQFKDSYGLCNDNWTEEMVIDALARHYVFVEEGKWPQVKSNCRVESLDKKSWKMISRDIERLWGETLADFKKRNMAAMEDKVVEFRPEFASHFPHRRFNTPANQNAQPMFNVA